MEQLLNFLSENYLEKPRKQNIVLKTFFLFFHDGLQRNSKMKKTKKNNKNKEQK